MKAEKARKQYFTRELMNWHRNANNRSLPWKSETDPYKIWLSEIILQQTRAQQGLPYYLKFTGSYPTIRDLAKAPDEEVFRIWQGLGYYNRCRNMLATARYISNELNGEFPRSYREILGLKGIGPYSAAAIASFAYGLPHAVVDGNVYRVLARFFGIDTPADSTEGKKRFAWLAEELLFADDSAAYNQAIMDIGATICKPKAPNCPECPLQKRCLAYKREMVDLLPIKAKKLTIRKRHFHFFLLTDSKSLWIHKRNGNDIWQNLYQPYLVEQIDGNSTKPSRQLKNLKIKEQPELLGEQTQRLTHQLIRFHFYKVAVNSKHLALPADGKWVPFEQLNNYAFPRTIVSFLEKIFYF